MPRHLLINLLKIYNREILRNREKRRISYRATKTRVADFSTETTTMQSEDTADTSLKP